MTAAPNSDSAQQLKAFIERLERLADERTDITEDIRGVRAEAKGQGFDLPTITLILKRRQLEPQQVIEADALLETYEQALGCGAAAAGVLSASRGDDGVFKVEMIAAPEAAEKLTKSQAARQAQMALAEMSRRAREG